jgi:hypothetical protein
MPGDPFKRAIPGQPLDLPAAAWNAFIDTTQAFRRQQRGQRPGDPSARDWSPGECVVQNATEDDLDRFAVLGISGPLIDPEDNEDGFAERLAFTGVEPTEDHEAGAFVVLQEPVSAGAIGRAVVAGATVCKLDVGDADHLYASAADGNAGSLVSAESGPALILWKQAGTGSGKWAVVRVGVEAERRPEGLVRVEIETDGGTSDEDATATATYTYAITDRTNLDGSAAAAGQSPEVPREMGYRNAATLGTAYYDAGGLLVLFQAFEPAGTGECDTSGGE